MDTHFREEKDFMKNIPVMMALVDYFHINVQNLGVKTVIPYFQSLSKFLLHVAQLEMESNGKVTLTDTQGKAITHTGGVVFGDTGSNCQHSFFQLIHQGRTVPVEFIAFINNPLDSMTPGHPISHHQELMMNYFAQVRCLALGRSAEECRKAQIPDEIVPHNVFEGNRPSSSLIFKELNARTLGQLYSIYENKVATEGFISGINSFDQYGVELGKKLCTELRNKLKEVPENDKRAELFGQDSVNGPLFKHFFGNFGI